MAKAGSATTSDALPGVRRGVEAPLQNGVRLHPTPADQEALGRTRTLEGGGKVSGNRTGWFEGMGWGVASPGHPR